MPDALCTAVQRTSFLTAGPAEALQTVPMPEFFDWLSAVRRLAPYRHRARTLAAALSRQRDRSATPDIFRLDRIELDARTALADLESFELDEAGRLLEVRASLEQTIETVAQLRLRLHHH